jgi:hypothetical protein
MDQLLTAIGVLFALFLVMSAAVEMILETFRGLLERLGITLLKGGVSLDDALQISAEFVPTGTAAAAKVSALIGVAKETRQITEDKLKTLKNLRDELVKTQPAVASEILEDVSQVVADVRETLSSSERGRVFWLRLLSAVIGVALAFMAEVDGLNLALKAAEFNLVVPVGMSTILTGLAAASGSSYWHDQLDRVRSLKGAYAQAAKLTGKP